MRRSWRRYGHCDRCEAVAAAPCTDMRGEDAAGRAISRAHPGRPIVLTGRAAVSPENYRETFLVRLAGGPRDGFETMVIDGDHGMGWPLPDCIGAFTDGVYRKIQQSALPAQGPGSHVVRGAAYRWEAKP